MSAYRTGYYADQLSVAQEVRGNLTIRVKNESRGFHLNNLSYAGPIVMGVGGNDDIFHRDSKIALYFSLLHVQRRLRHYFNIAKRPNK